MAGRRFHSGFRGGRGGFNRGRGGGFDRGHRGYDQEPPEVVTPLGHFTWTVQDELVVKVDMVDQVPFFNAPIYTENKQHIGKIDEIFGSIHDCHVSIKLSDNVKASSFEKDVQLYIDPKKLIPLYKILPRAPGEKRGSSTGRVIKRGAGGRGGGGRGGGGRGNSRGSYGRGGGGFGNRGAGRFRGRGGSNSGFSRNNAGGNRGGNRGRW